MDRGNVASQSFLGNQFVPVRFGNGGYEGTAALITEYEDGAAILELRTQFKAEDYPFIKFDIEGSNHLVHCLCVLAGCRRSGQHPPARTESQLG